MFKRENRLIPGVKFSNSYLFTAPQFILKEKKNSLDINRFGIVVSKKIDKRAVVRNKIKRFFREALINLNKNMVSGHDMLFIIRKGFIDKNEEENLLSIEEALKKAGIIKT